MNGNFKLQEKVNLAPFTYMKVGGPADYFAEVFSQNELVEAVLWARKKQTNFLVIGGGSNLIFPDEGFRGMVIRNRTDKLEFMDNNRLKAESGVLISRLVWAAIDHDLAGLEEFLGVPGTVGGAVFNNSHHLNHLIGDYIETVEVLNSNGEIKSYSQEEMKFAYDYSIIQETAEVILTAVFALTQGDQAELSGKAKAALQRRRDTQPLELPSSGCMFKNIGKDTAEKYKIPNGITSAGYLIDQAGLKGKRVGDAEVSRVHANFIVNRGKASFNEIAALTDKVKQAVFNKFGIELEKEVFFVNPQNGELK